MTIFMVTHDIGEAFRLGTRLIVFDKVRHDPHMPSAYGATITYDLHLKNGKPLNGALADRVIAAMQERERAAHA
jgi:NitT/TauT family transport system ATP-binding protein